MKLMWITIILHKTFEFSKKKKGNKKKRNKKLKKYECVLVFCPKIIPSFCPFLVKNCTKNFIHILEILLSSYWDFITTKIN